MIEVVCGVLENEAGQILACLRPEGKHLGGLWEFPGGKVDANELSEAALVRELQEELAVTVEEGVPLAPVVWDYGDRTIRLLSFRCRIADGREPQALEHQAILWCAPQNLPALAWAGADLPIIRHLVARDLT